MPETETHNPEKVLSVAQNVARVQERMRQAALRAGRDPAAVRLVAASKIVDTARIRAAIAAGVTIVDENYLQEARDKIGQLGRHAAEWHLIGTLQRNKVRYMFDLFDMMHALDSLALAEEINRRAEPLGHNTAVSLPVKVWGVMTKRRSHAEAALEECTKQPHIEMPRRGS